jgi:hypothetical protein
LATEPTPEEERALAPFLRDGRIVQIPRQRAKRLLILDLLSQQFEPGVRYTEREVNETIARFHPDTAALRRYLVDEEYMERDSAAGSGGIYWRAGGTFDI